MKTILHPTDFSGISRPAFKKAIELAKRDRAMLELLHVITPVIPVPGGQVPRSTYKELDAAATTSAHRSMEELVEQARAAGVKTTVTIVEGRPADRIVRAARARHADLIVIGTHGRTGLSRFLLGSVATRVISLSPCLVLTVRGRR